MQHVTLYFWRVRDAQGRWVTTRHRATEEQIRLTHPEAECLWGESLTIELPETPEAMALRLQQEHLHYPAIASLPRWIDRRLMPRYKVCGLPVN